VFWQGRRVFLTGHTGFKGAWLSLWLEQLGAAVTGFALAPPTQPSLFSVADVGAGMSSILGDIRNLAGLRETMHHAAPELVIHMAAQSLVRASYRDPAGTYATNVIGTVHVLEAARACPSVRAVLIVTSDKCYENMGRAQPFRETDRLGGHDPYSNSKACAELVTGCYRASFFPRESYASHGVAIATARAGNVIGGGDWALDRLLPDAVRAFGSGGLLRLRNPDTVRPWQHVLEPLRGYLTVAQALVEEGTGADGAWNFGPDSSAVATVESVICRLAACWRSCTQKPTRWAMDGDPQDRDPQPYEAPSLALDCARAATELGWRPALSFDQSIELTAEWYARQLAGEDGRVLCCEQIAAYCALLSSGAVCAC
jgi:CDP-glucose 4,6-dehydratase